MNLTSRNQDPIRASLALSSLLSVWYKPNSLNNKSIYNTLLLEFYICAKPRLTHWYPCPKKKCHYFCTGVYYNGIPLFSGMFTMNIYTNLTQETSTAGPLHSEHNTGDNRPYILHIAPEMPFALLNAWCSDNSGYGLNVTSSFIGWAHTQNRVGMAWNIPCVP